MYSRERELRQSSRWRTRAASISLILVSTTIGVGTNGGVSGASTSPEEVELRVTNISTPTISSTGDAVVTASIDNIGPIDATNVTVDYHLPLEVAASAVGTSSGCSLDDAKPGGIVTCAVTAVASGDSVEISIGLTAEPGSESGPRPALFGAVTSDEFNPASGEIRFRTWYHESDGQGANPLDCWQVEHPSPNMDIIGGGEGASSLCGGNVDQPALVPDLEIYLPGFPDPVSANVGYSWEIYTALTAPSDGDYRVCAYDIDDGAYLAIEPQGVALSATSVKFVASQYGTSQSTPFPLVGGTTYQVLLRIQNRGEPGLDNGGDGLGGFGSIGLTSGEVCDESVSDVFGTGPRAWNGSVEASVAVTPTTDLAITGSITSSGLNGRSISEARLENLGDNPVTPITRFSLTNAKLGSGEAQGCIIDPKTGEASCATDTMESGDFSTVSMNFSTDSVTERDGGWQTLSTDALDADPSNNFAPGW